MAHLTIALLEALPPLARATIGLAVLSGLRRGELFALRWKDIDVETQVLRLRQAMYDSAFDTPKTDAGVRQIALGAGPRRVSAPTRAQATFAVFSRTSAHRGR